MLFKILMKLFVKSKNIWENLQKSKKDFGVEQQVD